MHNRPPLALVLVLGPLTLLTTMSQPARDACAAPGVAATPVASDTAALAALPIAFVPNLGQWRSPALYRAEFAGSAVSLERRGWTLTLQPTTRGGLQGAVVRMTFAGVAEPKVIAERELPGRHNYFLGSDSGRWRVDVPLHASVLYRGVGAGVDCRARAQDGHFEYDLLLDPHADLTAVQMDVAGSEGLSLEPAGALRIDTAAGPVRMPVPVSWEVGPDGNTSPIACRYEVLSPTRFGFAVDARRGGWALVVDPGLVFSTFLGGSGFDHLQALAVDAQGVVTVAGFTTSRNFPTTPGAFQTTAADEDAFVTRLSSTGSSLVYSTYLGGNGAEFAYALAVSPAGAVTVTGQTFAANFPTTPGCFDATHNGDGDAFVARLSPTGSTLEYSTFLGGAARDSGNAVAFDSRGATTVAGETESLGFPTTPGSFDTTHNFRFDAFVARLSPTGSSLEYSTFLGGPAEDAVTDLCLDASGTATVVGRTNSATFPTTAGAFDTTFGGGVVADAFVTRLAATGASLVYSTFLGGSNQDEATALALDGDGGAVVVGVTGSADFPTTAGSFDRSYNGSIADAFVTRLAPTGATLDYSTFLGSSTADAAYAVALDAAGAATVAGSASADFPTTPGSFDRVATDQDAFVARLSPDASHLVYSTFLGGNTNYDIAQALAVDAHGAVTVGGRTASSAFPTTSGAYDSTHNLGEDGFVTRLDMLPTGVSAFGRSSPGCAGVLAASVNSMPSIGNQAFACTCTNGPVSGVGSLGLSPFGLTTPLVINGAELWVDPVGLVAVGAVSDARGASFVAVPIPNDPGLVQQEVRAQFFWRGPPSPPPCPPMGLSASQALHLVLQR